MQRSRVGITLGAAIPLVAAAPAPAVTIGEGHVDYAARIVGGKLVGQIKDDTGRRVRYRDPSTVTLRVGPKAQARLPKGMAFVGEAGSTIWLIPQVQKRGVVWAGWNTEAISRRQVRGGVRWTLERVSGPGRVVVFQRGSFGRSDILFSSARRRPGSRVIPLGTHAHANWAFTRRGMYRMRFRWSARSVSGTSLRHVGTLRVRVG